MAFQLQGKLHKKGEIQQIKDTFRKREFVIEFIDGNPMYPQYVSLQLIQDKVEMIEPFQEGQELQVEFNLRGREWRSPQGEIKYFNSLDAWRIQPVQQAQPAATPMSPPPIAPDSPAIDVAAEDSADDLPF